MRYCGVRDTCLAGQEVLSGNKDRETDTSTLKHIWNEERRKGQLEIEAVRERQTE